MQTMPPFAMWIAGRDDILAWMYGPGIGCRGSRVLPVASTNGTATFAQYKPSTTGSGLDAWALQVIEFRNREVVEFTFFLDTARFFPLYGLPARLDS